MESGLGALLRKPEDRRGGTLAPFLNSLLALGA